MSVYDDKDPSTPESLLEDAVKFAKEIFSDLKKAKISPSKFHQDVYEVSLECAASEEKKSVIKRLDPEATIICRESYSCHHPAIVDAFYKTLAEVLQRASLNEITLGECDDRRREAGKFYYNPGDFYHGGTRSITSIQSLSVAARTTPDQLKHAFSYPEDLSDIVLKALKTRFGEMAEFNELLKKHNIDMSLQDPEKIAKEFQKKGLRSPKVVKIKKDPDKNIGGFSNN